MKRLIAVLALTCGVGWGQSIYPFSIGAPLGVTNVSTQLTGNSGPQHYNYWVVANYPGGQAPTVVFSTVLNAPNTLTSTNYVTVFWNLVAGATSYDVLRTINATSLPNTCNACGVATGLSATTSSYVNNTTTTSGYTYAPIGNATAAFTFTNTIYPVPTVYLNAPLNVVNFASLPSASSSSGQLYIVADASSGTSCSAGGGTNTPAFCWSNGSTWLALGSSASAGVSSITGDGTLITNVASTGAVTLTLGKTFQGNGSKLQLSTGSPVSGHCTQFDANGNTVDAGAACGSGSGGTGNAAASHVVSFSATPTFTCGSASAGTVDDFALSTAMSANITSSTLSGCTTGQTLNFVFTQAASGGPFTVTMPTGFSQACQISPTANSVTKMSFWWDGTNGQLVGCSSTLGPSVIVTQSAPGVAAPSGSVFMWADLTNGTIEVENSAGNISVMPGIAACTSQVVTAIGTNAQIACSSLTTAMAGANVQGNGAKFQLSTGSPVSGHCAQFDANGNTVDSGGTCGGSSVSQIYMFGGGFVNAGSAIASGVFTTPTTAPASCTIKNWEISINATDSGTATVKFAKVASGTSSPGSGNLINTSGVSLSTGTHIYSSTVTDFTTTTVTAGDVIAADLTSVTGTITGLSAILYCQ